LKQNAQGQSVFCGRQRRALLAPDPVPDAPRSWAAVNLAAWHLLQLARHTKLLFRQIMHTQLSLAGFHLSARWRRWFSGQFSSLG